MKDRTSDRNHDIFLEAYVSDNNNKCSASQQLSSLNIDNIQRALNEAAIVAITDEKGVITYVNDKFIEISKYKKEELIGSTHQLLNSGHHSRQFFNTMWRTISQGDVWTGEIKNRAKDGSIYWVSTTIVPFLNDKQKPYKYIAIRTDITARMQMEKALQKALENDFQTTIKQLSNLIFKVICNDGGKFKFVMSEGKLSEKINFTTERIKDKDLYELVDNKDAKFVEAHLKKAFRGSHVTFEIKLCDSYFQVHLAPIYKENVISEVLGTMFDITKRKLSEEKVKYLAYHDSLTHLPNRMFMLERLEEEIEKGHPFSLLFLDLDRFKNINDTLGHSVGDDLLKSFSKRLLTFDTSKSIVSRFGGDEFLILLLDSDKDRIITFAHHLVDTLSGFYKIGELEPYINPSIGISLFPGDGHNPDELIKNADAAMYQAKAQSQYYSGSTFSFYEPSLAEDLKGKVLLEMELRKALGERQFKLYYQPQVDMKTNKIVGVEALIRWRHPELGLVSPLDFIPLAEETGLIISIGEWVLKTAIKQLKEWQNKGLMNMSMAINVSIRQFMSYRFADVVKKVLNDYQLNPKYLELEITENMTVDVKHAEKIINKLRDIGVKISIDDFGSGYSSLNYLSHLSINKLKIDRVFLLNLNERNKAVIKAVIALAKNLNIEVLAEGVETDKHVRFLKDEDCDLVQGYHYFKPLPAQELEKSLLEKK